MDISILVWILLVLGVLIILMSFVSPFVPVLKSIASHKQHFQGLGLTLDVNMMVLMLLLGIVLLLPGLYIYVEDFEGTTSQLQLEISKARSQIERLTQEQEEGKVFTLVATLQFKGMQVVRDDFLNSLDVFYSTPQEHDILISRESIRPGASPLGDCLSVTIRDFPRGEYITRIRAVGSAGTSEWTHEKLTQPLMPVFDMEKRP